MKLTPSMVKQRETRRSARVLRQLSAGKITLNQAREKLGLSSLPAGIGEPHQVADQTIDEVVDKV